MAENKIVVMDCIKCWAYEHRLTLPNPENIWDRTLLLCNHATCEPKCVWTWCISKMHVQTRKPRPRWPLKQIGKRPIETLLWFVEQYANQQQLWEHHWTRCKEDQRAQGKWSFAHSEPWMWQWWMQALHRVTHFVTQRWHLNIIKKILMKKWFHLDDLMRC